jgi:uncharacterized coiled-coil DUF342 family protein
MLKYAERPLKPSEFQSRLDELCAARDEINAANAPLEAQLAKANAQAEALRVQAQQLADQIDDNRGRVLWIRMKSEIRVLTKALATGARSGADGSAR